MLRLSSLSTRLIIAVVATATVAFAASFGLTIVRLVVTRRRLLEWETAAAASAKAAGFLGQSRLGRFMTDMVASPLGGPTRRR